MRTFSLLWILFFLFAPLTVAEEKVENYNAYESLTLDFHLRSGVQIDRFKSDARIQSVEASVRFFPKADYRQQVLMLETASQPEAEAKTKDEAVVYTWRGDMPGSAFTYEISGTVKTLNVFSDVRREIKFPLQQLDDELLQYTRSTKYIDINDDIESQARTVVSGETDLYRAVFKLADWVKNNIKYDLSTLTAEAVQKSSWVFANKEGVCDEITNLFISFARSLGIPARFVSGMVYSNLDYKFWPHGWAEVYFPGVGWVPFDVTFGQYGWLDPSHVKLDDDADSGTPTAQYNWVTYGVEMHADEIDLTTEVQKTGELIETPVGLTVEPYTLTVGPGSYVPMLVTVQNKRDYYVAPSIIVRKAPQLTEKNVREILLGPHESKTVLWIIEVPEAVEEGYIYTSALEVTSSHGGMAASELKYGKEYATTSLEQAQAVVKSYQDKSKKHEFRNLQLRCYPDKKIYYSGDTVTITCAAKNDGVAVTFDLCLRSECQVVFIDTGATKNTLFTVKAKDSGRLAIVAENTEMIKHAYVDLNVIEVADVSLTSAQPKTVPYNDDVQLTLVLESNSEVHDVNVDFGFDVLHYDTFEGTRTVVIKTNGKTVYKGLTLNIAFKDAAGKAYQKTDKLGIEVIDVPWHARFAMWLAGFFT